MKVLYLDCFSGISGDMFLGAMLDLGLNEKTFLEELKKLPLTDYEVEIKKSSKGGITGTAVHVKTHEHHPHRGLKDIYDIIDNSSLNPEIKQKSKEAFLKLARAEGKIHGRPPEEIHFHEVGAVDSIVDIVGACILTDMLSPDRIYASPVNVGSGTVECAHGVLPVPAPAAMELLKGIPVYSRGEEGELTTPTGALLLSIFVDEFGAMPSGVPESAGYGLGKADRRTPNVLRAVVLKEQKKNEDPKEGEFDGDSVAVLEANIDDMNPQFYEGVMESLFEKGALDVFLTPVIMKKSRPAIKLTCICRPERKRELSAVILEETTTIGVRECEMNRMKLFREIKSVPTPLGEIRAKVSKKGGRVVRVTPEYDDLKALARRHDLSLNRVSEMVGKYLNTEQ
ncbi:nickel pincer cofactor biosynthesis protein LarC [Thermoanaerobacterium sp. DL9XJH110]|uniref:nickel pincer cofactor biosynthesis protein LarC n=1 Tax=Thermoanaerobacterium sp. DL9XJH110 TaxID=3386643 RepID=UPI003BB6D90D